MQSIPAKTILRNTVSIADVPCPGEAEMTSVVVPETLRRKGVTDLVLVGPGQYYASPDTISWVSAGFKSERPLLLSNAKNGGGRNYMAGWNLKTPSLLVVLEPQTTLPMEAIYQVRQGNRLTRAKFERLSNRKELAVRSFVFEPEQGGALVAGEKMHLEYFEPVTLSATFYFPAPKPPQEK